ncbi:TonB-dependent receptor [Pollutibacter soli]|uniref:TonB-dependent receptor n=1 Tax=Pollutibacter soli TaxID=3034157 RepID=UPI003013AA36
MMKLTVFLTIVLSLNVSSKSFSQNITLTGKDMPLLKVFRTVEKQSGYSFVYEPRILKNAVPVTVDVRNGTLAEVLEICLKNQNLSWEIKYQTIIVRQIEKPKIAKEETLLPPKEITGKITDESGSPLGGVTITIKGTRNAVMSDDAGNYTITVPDEKSILIFTYVGFNAVEHSVAGKSAIDIRLGEKEKDLNQVVIVGYGTRSKRSLTGSISSVRSDDLKVTPIANLAQGLQGRVAGLDMRQNSGLPGGNISVRIRGTNSINGTSEPLYVIDGIQISATSAVNAANPLSQLNPSDIESVEILKDAAATAIYGARAANGVVLITTKRGKDGVARVTYDGYYGFQEVSKQPDILNATEFAKLENDTYSPNVIYADPESLGEGTNYLDMIFRRGAIQNHQVSVTGGNEKTQVALGLNYFDQEGVIKNSDYTRYAVRLNIDQRINDRVKVGTSLYYTHTQENRVRAGGTGVNVTSAREGILGRAVAAPPNLLPYRANGLPYPFADQMNGRYRETINPMAELAKKDYTTTNRFLANAYLDVRIINGLTYRASFNADVASSLNELYSPRYIVDSLTLANPAAINGSASNNSFYNTSLLHESILTYKKSIAKNHSINATGVFAIQSDQLQTNNQTASGFGNDFTENWSTGTATNYSVSSSKAKSDLISYLLRLGYGFKDRYFLDASARVDGSSKFGANNKYGFFPSVSAAWRIIDEPFMSKVDFLSDLKLRGSWGITGNAGAIGPYGSLATVTATGGYNYNFNNVTQIGTYPSGIANPDLRWEQATQVDVGLDMSFFRNRLNVVVDYYNKRTDDLLFSKSLPMSSGYTSITGNYGSIENKGWELSLSGKILTGALTWEASGNITWNKNKVLGLDGVRDEIQQSSYSILKKGYPLGVYRVYIIDGINQTGEPFLPGYDARTGGFKLKDLNKDGKISNEDLALVGNAQPNYFFGFSTILRYRHFDLSTLIQGVQGSRLFNAFRFTFETPSGQVNLLKQMVDRWTPTNPSNDYVKGAQGTNLPIGDRWVEDNSYVRIKNITLGYTIPPQKWMRSLRVYASVTNPFTFTKYQGWDPESNSYGSSNSLFYDNGTYPAAVSYVFGLQASF